MSSLLALLASLLALSAMGAATVLHPAVQRLSPGGRAAAAFGAGATILTVEALAFSFAGVRWSITGLAAPVLAVSAAALWRRWGVARESPPAYRPSRFLLTMGVLATGAAFLYLLFSLRSSRATSTDFLLFWGVKGVRFAEARGIDVGFLKSTFAFHVVPGYPPLVPVVDAWGVLFAGKMLWLLAPLTTAVWLAAAVPLLLDLLRRRLDDDTATGVTAFWTVAMSISLVSSFSGASAEAPLVFFESVAIVALMVESEGDSRFLPALASCGAVLTKAEGLTAVSFLVAGSLLRDLLERRRAPFRRMWTLALWPGLAVSSWFLFQWHAGLEVGYRAHGPLWAVSLAYAKTVAAAGFHYLNAGTGGLSWTLPGLLLLLFGRQWKPLIPALVLTGGLLLFFTFDYLHDATDPTKRIEWTLPRVSQAPLSAFILAAGVAMARRRRGGQPGEPDPGASESRAGPPPSVGAAEISF